MGVAITAGHGPPGGGASWRESPAGEAAFGLDCARDLHVGMRWPVAQAGAFLAHAIARRPADLLAHVQRVELWVENGHRAETWAAVLDLFIALGARGAALRARMLRLAQPLLAPECARFLATALPAGVEARHAHPPAPGSMLSRGMTGGPTLITRLRDPGTAAADPLQEADDYIAEGNVDAARTTLETALAATPARAELAGALLDLYRRTRDAAALRAMRVRLGTDLRSVGAWDTVERDIAGRPGAIQ